MKEVPFEGLSDRGHWPRISFAEFLDGLKGAGFVTSNDLLKRLYVRPLHGVLARHPRPAGGLAVTSCSKCAFFRC